MGSSRYECPCSPISSLQDKDWDLVLGSKSQLQIRLRPGRTNQDFAFLLPKTPGDQGNNKVPGCMAENIKNGNTIERFCLMSPETSCTRISNMHLASILWGILFDWQHVDENSVKDSVIHLHNRKALYGTHGFYHTKFIKSFVTTFKKVLPF
ncbi:hypothetical protein CDAR_609181 [Caerostris darwini]|uniref:LAGLIDADG homing endonuclease n=1 Tax=Caerostris darwini TaxID=1538125 RepID=A0AAV4U466_9ARAC|nr:hypothetical protein CDAR_609181 [Caerostris darwini]